MSFAFISVLAALIVLIALNWQRLNALGPARVARMLGIWTAIIVCLVLLVRFLGLA